MYQTLTRDIWEFHSVIASLGPHQGFIVIYVIQELFMLWVEYYKAASVEKQIVKSNNQNQCDADDDQFGFVIFKEFSVLGKLGVVVDQPVRGNHLLGLVCHQLDLCHKHQCGVVEQQSNNKDKWEPHKLELEQE